MLLDFEEILSKTPEGAELFFVETLFDNNSHNKNSVLW